MSEAKFPIETWVGLEVLGTTRAFELKRNNQFPEIGGFFIVFETREVMRRFNKKWWQFWK